MELFWAQRKFVKTILLNSKTNIGMTTTAPGIVNYKAFIDSCKNSRNPKVFEAHVIEDDDIPDDVSFQPPDPVHQNEPGDTTQITEKGVELQTDLNEIQTLDFEEIINIIPPDEDDEPESIRPKDELMRWHMRLNHLSYDRMRGLMKRGLLPKRLLDVKEPCSAACQYGRLHRRPWRDKGDEAPNTLIATAPGQIVSVDQMESTTVGFIAQLKGKLTTKRYQYATVFVDQFSRLSYVFLQKSLNSAETVIAKQCFELYANDRGVKIKRYHADNGRFADNGFIESCKAENQRITYCGVNAHFQNGIAEKRIRDLQEATRTSILFAMHKWPKMVNINLWPYA
jgi:hypothetical protein